MRSAGRAPCYNGSLAARSARGRRELGRGGGGGEREGGGAGLGVEPLWRDASREPDRRRAVRRDRPCRPDVARHLEFRWTIGRDLPARLGARAFCPPLLPGRVV